MEYLFPATLFNGTLKRADSDADFVRGKILQTLSVMRGELVFDAFYGMPLRVFTAITSIETDAANVESILTDEIPEATFSVRGGITEDGVGNLIVYWTYQGATSTETFTVTT